MWILTRKGTSAIHMVGHGLFRSLDVYLIPDQHIPSFNLTDRDQFKQACHYTNLQPLWAKENLSKGAST